MDDERRRYAHYGVKRMPDEILDTILDAVGNTPLVRLSRLAADTRTQVVAKVETLNPGGSVKDRIGLAMIEAAEAAGQLRPGATIVEPTSGNTGTGLAIAAALKGYRLVCVMPDKMSTEKIALLRAYGAEVVVCPTAVPRESPQSYYSVADRLAREIPGAFQPNQYFNPANPAAHEATTGPEIWRQTDGRITHFVAGMGTGGTITGVGRVLKAHNPSVQVVGADPVGSIYSAGAQLHAQDLQSRGHRRRLHAQHHGPEPGRPHRGRRRQRELSHGPAADPRGGHPGRRLGRRGRRGGHARGRRDRRSRGAGRGPVARHRPQLPEQDLQRGVDARRTASSSSSRRTRWAKWSACAPPSADCLRSSASRRATRVRAAIDTMQQYGISQLPVVES